MKSRFENEGGKCGGPDFLCLYCEHPRSLEYKFSGLFSPVMFIIVASLSSGLVFKSRNTLMGFYGCQGLRWDLLGHSQRAQYFFFNWVFANVGWKIKCFTLSISYSSLLNVSTSTSKAHIKLKLR